MRGTCVYRATWWWRRRRTAATIATRGWLPLLTPCAPELPTTFTLCLTRLSRCPLSKYALSSTLSPRYTTHTWCGCPWFQIWNYSKRPERGARSVEVWVDGLLVFRGALPPARTTGAYQAILFSGAADIVEREQPHVRRQVTHAHTSFTDLPTQVAYCGTSEQRVALFNDGVLVPRPGSPQGERPNPTAVGVAIDLAARPTTSAGTRGTGGVAR